MKRIFVLLVGALLVSASLFATTVIPFNSRTIPICIGVPPGGMDGCLGGLETPLQTVLDTKYSGLVNVVTGQQSAGMWALSTGGAGLLGPVLQLEQSAWGAGNIMGMWSGTDTPLQELNIFLGAATEPSALTLHGATITWGPTGIMYVTAAGSSVCGVHVNCVVRLPTDGDYISPWGFGYYLKNETGGFKYYTADNLNLAGSAQALTYRGTPSGGAETWVIAFEEQLRGAGGASDYNDFVFSVESMIPIPEPGAVLFMGTVVAALGISLRRRRRA